MTPPTSSLSCQHPFKRLTFVYEGHDGIINKIGCGKCNKWLFDRLRKESPITKRGKGN